MVVTERNRQSSITLTVIDLEKAMKDLYEHLKEDGQIPEDVIKVEPLGSHWAYIQTPKGLFLLDEDACSPGGDERPITENSDVRWPIYFHMEDSIALFPSIEIHLTPKFIKELPTKGEANFGEWVRKFGHRLESNFHNWNNFLEDLMGTEETNVR